jgi:hypothetical protein
MTNPTIPFSVPDGRVVLGGKEHMVNSKGGYDPISTIKPQHRLEDQTVRKMMGFALELSDRVSRFKLNSLEDLMAFEAILEEEYGAQKGGKRGNKTFMTHDALMKVQIRIADFIDFGPELSVAEELFNECLNEWASDARDELRLIVTSAFNTDKPGQINRSELFRLLRTDIKDERWQRALGAIRDAMRVVGSKSYIRFYRRDNLDAPWKAITIDLAKA